VFVVTQSGAIEDVRVERTSGNDEMDAEAVRVIRKCSKRYKPAKNNGKPVKSIFRIGITFQLEEE
jgi:TonB family protein